MTIEFEPVLLDTNVLVYALDEESPHHGPSRAIVERAAKGEGSYRLAPRILAEFFSIVTNPRRVRNSCTALEAVMAIDSFLAMPEIALLSIGLEVVERWLAMVRAAPVTGANVFDIQLAATALGSGVSKVCTFNVARFERIDGIEVTTP